MFYIHSCSAIYANLKIYSSCKKKYYLWFLTTNKKNNNNTRSKALVTLLIEPYLVTSSMEEYGGPKLERFDEILYLGS
jgi:hypothetical protein